MPTQEEQQQITALVRRFEAETGVQAVAAVTQRADAYPDIPWKAYAMGSALGAIVAALDVFTISGWSHASVIALDAMLILAGGVLFTVLASFVPPVARLFLDRVRAHAECLQYAQGVFLDHECFCTHDRCAVLVVMCRFERIGVILADSGLAQYAPREALSDIGAETGRMIGSDGVVAAFDSALTRVKELLARNDFKASAPGRNELPDEVIMEKP